MIKANAYGCGAPQVAKTLSSIGIKKLGVICFEEAMEITNHIKDTDIYIFGPLESKNIPVIQEYGFVPVIGNWEDLKKLSEIKQTISFHIKFNTGMNRIGFSPSDINQLKEYIQNHPHLKLQGLASHLSEGETAGLNTDTWTTQQIYLFKKICQTFDSFFPSQKPSSHLLSSAGWWALWSHFKQEESLGFRPGLSLYGVKPSILFQSSDAKKKYHSISLKQVLCLKSYIAQTHLLQVGQTVSYGNTWKANKPSTVAVVSMGYADGLPYTLSNKGSVLFRGKKSPIIGRICMDFFMIDVTESSKEQTIQPGEEVVIFGSQHNHSIPVEEQAEAANCVPHDLLTRCGNRVRRVYKDNNCESR